MTAPARTAAWRALRRIHETGTDLPIALARERDRLADARDRALATEITLGVLRWQASLDYLITRAAKRALDAIDAASLDVLRVGAYQLLHLTRVPAPVVVDEAVELVKRAHHPRAAGFINATLRQIAATGGASLPKAPPLPPPPGSGAARRWRQRAVEHLAITLSHPRWLVERWIDAHGFQAACEMARFNNGSAPLTLRANPLRTTPAALATTLEQHGIETRPGRYAPDALLVTSGHPFGTPPFEEGACFLQDEASQAVGVLAAAACGSPALDACASPGGKTLALAAGLEPGAFIVAADTRPARVQLLRNTLQRAGTEGVHLVQVDLTRGLPFRELFQGVLLDVPCSGLGTVRRDPDIRWKRTPDDLIRFPAAQRVMLREAARVVAPGGRLVYATCSSEPEENQDVVAHFLAEHDAFALVDARGLPIPDAMRTLVDAEGFLRTLPQLHGLESFFAAVIARAA